MFFASHCGETSRAPPSATALNTEDVHDHRLWSLDAAVEFSKMNNFLGVLLDAGLLVRPLPYSRTWALLMPCQARVPSLIQGVKDFGLLVGTYGLLEDVERLPTSASAEANGIDAALHDGVLTYFNHKQRGMQGL